jgi:ATPase subunit of ABC transporter with duplicated ATPase domains
MTAEIVNLNKARKAREREQDKKCAEENRVRYGRTRAEKETAARNEAARLSELDGTKLTPRPSNEHDDLEPGLNTDENVS